MAKAILLNDNGDERDYRIPSGEIITLIFNEFDNTITFKQNNIYIGDEFKFKDEDEFENRYLLARMYSPIIKSGLGRAAIEFFKQMTGASIYTRPNDGVVRDDGSHLTEDACSFVCKMQQENLIEPWDNY